MLRPPSGCDDLHASHSEIAVRPFRTSDVLFVRTKSTCANACLKNVFRLYRVYPSADDHQQAIGHVAVGAVEDVQVTGNRDIHSPMLLSNMVKN